MKITKENFNEIAAVALQLLMEACYTEAAEISELLMDVYHQSYTDDMESALDIMRVVKTHASAFWRYAVENKEYTMLSEELASSGYESEEIGEEMQSDLGGYVLHEAALAYEALGSHCATREMADKYNEYAQTCALNAIKVYESLAEKENDSDYLEMALSFKVDLARIQLNISNRIARNTAISLLGENLSDEERQMVLEVYEKATDYLFDNFFALKSITAVNTTEDVSESVKDEVSQYILRNTAEGFGTDDPFPWLFTHKESPEERELIRFVEKIEDAADNDFDLIPWVFTLDRYPSDIEFEEGEEPIEDSVYEIDEENTSLYHKL